MNIFKSLAIVVASCLMVGCASFGMRLDPGEGKYELVIGASDCMDTNNIVGSIVQAIPFVGEWASANFGCKSGTVQP